MGTRRRERCPACGALTERRQLVCLGCGGRLALEPKARGGRPALAAAAALAAVSLISLAFVAEALIGSGDGSQPAAKAGAAAAPSFQSGPDAAQRKAQRRARTQLATAIPGWPATQAGWTVVLLGTSDPRSADDLARQLGDSGVDAGVISPAERPDLGTLWLVYAGVRKDQQSAIADVTRLRANFSGAYVRFVPTAPNAGAPAPTPPG
jgi:SPOR domain